MPDFQPRTMGAFIAGLQLIYADSPEVMGIMAADNETIDVGGEDIAQESAEGEQLLAWGFFSFEPDGGIGWGWRL